MSRYRRVEVGTWNDGGFRALSAPPPNGQTLWMYLLCGQRTISIPGVVVAREAVIADDLRWQVGSLREAMEEVIGEGMAKADWEAGLVVLPKALVDENGVPRESNKPQSANVVKGWAKAWQDIPDCALKIELLGTLRVFCSALPKAFADAFADAFAKPLASLSNTGSGSRIRKQDQEKNTIRTSPAGPRPVEPCDEFGLAEGTSPGLPAPPDPDAFELADQLRVAVLASKPNHRVGEDASWRSTRRAWAKCMATTLRRRPRAALEAAIRFVGEQGGQPYAFVVESAKAFDDKLDRIELAMARPPGRGNGNGGGGLSAEELFNLGKTP